MDSRLRPHFGDQLAFYPSKLQTRPVKNAFLLIARDMQTLDRTAIDDLRFTLTGIGRFQTVQISPGAAFFPRRDTIAIIIAFEQQWRHQRAKRRGY